MFFLKRILLTAEEAVAASESSAGTENLDAFLDTLEKMEPSEIISKYGEKLLWALVTVVVGLIYFYVVLPPLSVKSPDFYSFIFLLCIVYCGMAVLTTGFQTNGGAKEYFKF